MKEGRNKRLHIIGFHLCEIFGIGKSVETKSKLVVARGWWGGEEGGGKRTDNDCSLVRASLWGYENVLEFDSGIDYTTL